MSEVDVDTIWPAIERFYKVVGFDPLPPQKELLCSQYLFNLFAGGVGAGKSLTAAQFMAMRMLSVPLPGANLEPIYWLVGESLDIPKIEMTYIMDTLETCGMELKEVSRPTEGRWTFRIPGVCVAETRSWTNWDSLHGKAVQGMLICEAGLLPARVWHERLRGRMSRVTGAWALLSGTLEDSGPFFKDLVRDVVVEDKRPEWFGVSMASWENTHRFPLGMEDPEIQLLRETTPPDIFMERYGAIPKTVAALVYREFSHSYHVGHYRFDSNQPVYIWVDPGGTYALNAAQKKGDDIFIIDEIHVEQGSHENVIAEAVSRPWWKNVEHGAMDATQVQARMMWAEGRVWSSVDAEAVPIVHRKVPVEPGIELVRTQLHSGLYDPEEDKEIWEFQGRKGVARLHVDAGCTHTIKEFTMGYKRKRLASGQYSDNEVMKRDDHHMDAIRYGLADMLGFSESARPSVRAARQWYDSRPISVH